MRKLLLLTLAVLIVCAGLSMAAEEFQVRSSGISQNQSEYAPGEIVVKFKTDVDELAKERVSLQLSTSIITTSKYSGVSRISVPPDKTVEEMVELYKADPNVEYAEPNFVYRAFMTPNDTYYSYQWHMPMINMEEAWDLSTGTDVVVAVIDCGVAYEDYGNYYQAPDLAGTQFVSGYDFANNDSHPNDDEGHGTHVTGTIAQTTNNSLGVTGVAFDCSIMPVKVLDASGSGYLTDIADGIIWAADNGAHVINMSLGGSSSSTTLEDACEYAYNKGVVICVAAGNAGTSTAQYPAAYSTTISVSAVTVDSSYTSYTSYGSTIDICAPGGDTDYDLDGDGYVDGVLQQTHDGSDYSSFSYYFYQGTSMACPHVAGAAALILAKAGGGFSLSPDSVKAILQNTAVDLGSSGWDQYYGLGLIDVYGAVSAVGEVENPPVAEFTASPTSGCVSLTVSFTDASSNDPTSWSWSFGDGGTSSSQNPSHTYTAAGTYTVTLTATNAYGSDSETKTGYITVNEGPTASFSGSPTSGEVPLTVSFTDGSTGATSWSWDFGDGGSSTSQNPSHTYNSAGTYTVALTATNSCGNDTYTRTNYITVTCTPPVAAFSGSPTSGDFPLTVNFTDASTGATSWSWDFGDGGSSTSQNPSHTYNSAGTYTVTLTVSNSCGSDTYTRTDYVTVTCTAPTAAFSGSPTSGDFPLTVNFTDASTGATSWSWDFGDGGTSTAQNPSHTYTTAGTFTVALTVSNACGSDAETKAGYIYVTEPTGDYANLPYSTGFESGFDAYWTTYTTNEGRVQVTSANTPHSGSYHMTMDDYTSGGNYSQCEAWLALNLAGKSDVDLTFWWKEFGDETHTQDGIYFSDNNGSSFTKVYSLAGGTTTYQQIALDVDQLAATYGLNLTGTFIVKFQQYDNYPISSDGMAFDDISVISNEVPPTAAFAGDPTSGTVPLTVNFNDQSTQNPSSWSWTFGDGGTSTAQNPSHVYNAVGTYTVSLTATNAFGSDTETKTGYITVNEVGENVMHVYDIVVTRVRSGSRYLGRAVITIYDQNDNPVEGATVYAAYTGSNSGSLSGTTNSSGQVTLSTPTVRRYTTEWCFEVTNVVKTDWTYDESANEVTKSCQSGDVFSDGYVEFLPTEYSLTQNYPNPFNPVTNIAFSLPEASNVKLTVYNIRGQVVSTLVDNYMAAGTYNVYWDASDNASGIYFYRLQTSEFTETKKMILLK